MPANVICITNRHLCSPSGRSFLEQLEKIAQGGPRQIILREKDLDEESYLSLLLKCRDICQAHAVPLYAHTFIGAAKAAGISRIHLPLPLLIKNGGRPKDFTSVGTSIHSLEDAKKAAALGVDYMTAGHIFETDCKAGLPGRGLRFLAKVCAASPVPVYAIGGITPQNMPNILNAGAAGGCMMSSLMGAKNPETLL